MSLDSSTSLMVLWWILRYEKRLSTKWARRRRCGRNFPSSWVQECSLPQHMTDTKLWESSMRAQSLSRLKSKYPWSQQGPSLKTCCERPFGASFCPWAVMNPQNLISKGFLRTCCAARRRVRDFLINAAGKSRALKIIYCAQYSVRGGA